MFHTALVTATVPRSANPYSDKTCTAGLAPMTKLLYTIRGYDTKDATRAHCLGISNTQDMNTHHYNNNFDISQHN